MSKDGRSATRVCTDMTKNADVDESPVYSCARNNGPLRTRQPGVIAQFTRTVACSNLSPRLYTSFISYKKQQTHAYAYLVMSMGS
jgi:hypothetical protein